MRAEAFCQQLRIGSERGHRRPEIRESLRIVGFEHRPTIAFVVAAETMTILQVFGAGRSWEPVL